LARLAGAPFLKVEASKFTEVGYVGRDVESMVRELVDVAINMVRTEREDDVYPQAEARAEERLLDLLLPPTPTHPTAAPPHPPQGMEGTDVNFTELLQEMLPKKKKRRTVHLHEARRILVDEELKKLVDMDDVVNESLDRVENHGVIFIDEIDKIAGERGTVGPDVSREGV